MIDTYGRDITYLRLSVTDRCNLRCVYCMGDDPEPLARPEVLRIEELLRLARCFIRLGVRKIRITGGEPLVRKGVLDLVDRLGEEVAAGHLGELTMTTNGLLLADCAGRLKAAGMRRVNVSLDTLDPDLFRRITRWGRIERVLEGIDAAREAGLKVKLNVVPLKGINDRGVDDLIAWAGARGHDVTLIETMPLGGLVDMRADQFLSLEDLRQDLASRWTLVPEVGPGSGPARFYKVAETGCRLGFIAALSHRFCASCDRVRVNCTGALTWCLGQGGGVELRELLRASPANEPVESAILADLGRKPAGHHFAVGAAQAGLTSDCRHRMNRMGG